MTAPYLDVNKVRRHFPALQSGMVFMDNAGGSQILDIVVDRITEYLTHYNVQLGASYQLSVLAEEKCHQAHADLAAYINAQSPDEVIMGASCTMVLRLLSLCLVKQWSAGDEVIVTNSEHAANLSCWRDLKAQGIVVRTWQLNPDTLEFELDDLHALISDRTKLVTVTHVSNILGSINSIGEIAKTVHDFGALLCVDGVALAPHRAVDVQAWDVDFYTFSWYKVYGPHQGLLYGKRHLLESMPGINHHGIDAIPYKFQPGNFNYELTYGSAGVISYLVGLYDAHYSAAEDNPEEEIVQRKTREKTHQYEKNQKHKEIHKKVTDCFQLIADYEELLAGRLLDFLDSTNHLKIIGHSSANQHLRVPTISFIHHHKMSSDIVHAVDRHNIGIRFGNFHSKELVDSLQLRQKDGVIRVSLAHYNTTEEVDRLIHALETVV